MGFSWKDRQTAIDSLADHAAELLIIGGGIVGCSIAAHAAELGIDCILLEREDLAYGASGNSTGLAHAGLRYLAQGRLFYVFQESRERHRLQRLAPHWVRPFDFLFPVYKEDPFGFRLVRLGTWIYDFFSWIDALLDHRPRAPRHRVVSAAELVRRVPGIRTEGLQGATEYFVDGRLRDTRVTLGFAQKAAARGARIITHAEVESFIHDAGATAAVNVRDRVSGKMFTARARLIVNASGAWIDGVRQKAGLGGSVLLKSQGIHLVVDRVVETPLILSTRVPGRVFFILPTGRDASVIGTTDTVLEGPPDEARPKAEEIEELIRYLFQFFPYLAQGGNLTESLALYKQVHVRDVYWGIRPLLRQPGSSVTASREHALLKESPRFWSIPGVKLTAGRSVGEQVAHEAWKALRQRAKPRIDWAPLPGGEFDDYHTYVAAAQKRFRLENGSDDLMAYLVGMYGTRYVEVLQWAHRELHYREQIIPQEPWILAEAAYAAEQEMVLTLNDFLWRRTRWAHLRDLPADAVRAVAGVLAQFLQWSALETERQIQLYTEEMGKHRIPASHHSLR